MNTNTEREELAEVLANARYSNLVPAWPLRADRSPVKFFSRKAADAILAAGYRKPRTITTVEELDALPFESVVRDAAGHVLERWGDALDAIWVTAQIAAYIPRGDIALPATVLYTPEPTK